MIKTEEQTMDDFKENLRKKAEHKCPKCGGDAYEAPYPGGVATCLDCGHGFPV